MHTSHTNCTHRKQALADMAFDRVQSRVPPQYLLNALASCLAAQLVYAEGVAFVNAQPPARLGPLALDYARQAADVKALVAAVSAADGVSALSKEQSQVGPVKLVSMLLLMLQSCVGASSVRYCCA
jgi:drug/metabolite transporter (DMT)-like permease